MIEPWWPLAGLAAIQVLDAAFCVRPVPFVARCLEDVRLPRRWWRLLPPLKLAAAAGLVLGILLPPLALLTCGCLVAYFVVAIGMHLRARDIGRTLLVNATGMLVLCAATLGFVLVEG